MRRTIDLLRDTKEGPLTYLDGYQDGCTEARALPDHPFCWLRADMAEGADDYSAGWTDGFESVRGAR